MLGLLGDMLIASALPARIKRDVPASHITWLVDAACAPVLHMNPDIDRVLIFDWRASEQLAAEKFDKVFSFERTPSAAALVHRISATHKAGLAYGGESSGLYPIGHAARHFFLMNLWNDYRTRRNQKTWTELYFEVAGYDYNREPYVLRVSLAARERVYKLLPSDGVLRVCLNVGGSLPTKVWPATHWISLGKELLSQDYHLVITGGPADAGLCTYIERSLATSGKGRAFYVQTSIEEFAVIPALCDAMVTGDSFGFHLALAHECPCVLLLGPSNGAEIVPKHLDQIAILRSSLPCSPCAHQVTCGGVGGCMEAIHPTEVLSSVTKLLGRTERSHRAEIQTS